MISNFKNSDELLKSTKFNQGDWLNPEDSELLKMQTVTSSIDLININPKNIELHIYDLNGGYIGGNHDIDEWNINGNNVELNIHKNIRDLGLRRGEYKFVYNFLSNKIGAYQSPVSFFIKEIKSNKQEIILGTNVISSDNILYNIFLDKIKNYFESRLGVKELKYKINNSIEPKYQEIRKIILFNAGTGSYDEQLDIEVQNTITKGIGTFKTQKALELEQIVDDDELLRYWFNYINLLSPTTQLSAVNSKIKRITNNQLSPNELDNVIDKIINESNYQFLDYKKYSSLHDSQTYQNLFVSMGLTGGYFNLFPDKRIPQIILVGLINQQINKHEKEIYDIEVALLATGNSTTQVIDIIQETNIQELNNNIASLKQKLNEIENDVFIRFSKTELNFLINESKNYIKNLISLETEVISNNELSSIISNTTKLHHQNLCLNFGSNKIYPIINIIRLSATEIGIKLYEPINDIIEKQLCWIAEMFKKSYIDNIILIPLVDSLIPNTLQGPNFSINVDDGFGSDTEFQTWNDLLGSDVDTSQKIIDGIFSGSAHADMKINIDYSNFENFIHFSSAVERVKNFQYKLGMIEDYDDRLIELVSASLSGSVANNITDITNKRNNIIGGFDDFEKYLYFQSGSNNFYTHADITEDDGTEQIGTIYSWPKKAGISSSLSVTWVEAAEQWSQMVSAWKIGQITEISTTRPYALFRTTDSESLAYYENLLDQADLYDRRNEYALVKTIPEHIRIDSNNSQYELFVNMIGHHFDILWTYIKYLTKIHSREEHPQDGISNDLIYEVARSFGWKLHNGNFNKDLWRYVLGTNEVGDYNDNENLLAKASEDFTHEVWRRQLNNLPYLLKTKGTARSIRALISCYGVPSTILNIKEYGGPSKKSIRPVYVKNQFDHAINIAANRHLKTEWNKVYYTGSTYRFPDTITLRFKPHLDSVDDFLYDEYGKHTLLQIDSGSDTKMMVTLEPSGSYQKGNIHFYLSGSSGYLTASINNQYIFDDEFSTIMIKRNTSSDVTTIDNTYNFYLKKSKYGKITINASASIDATGSYSSSYNTTWTTSGSMYIGLGNNPDNSKNFTGSVQDLRYWIVPLNENIFNIHVKSPGSYNSNNPTSSYDDLRVRFMLTDSFDAQKRIYVSSSHPNQNFELFNDVNQVILNLQGTWPSESLSWNGIEETHYIEGPSIGGNNLYSEKIRIEDNSITEPLDSQRKVETSVFDTAPLDSKRLGIYFSPTSVTNDDIIRHLGFIELDDYIGDPRDKNKTSYQSLRRLAREYWKKYENKNDIAGYIRIFSLFDFSLFKQIEQLLPARTNKILGLVIEPNILERSKVSFTRNGESKHENYEIIIDENTKPIFDVEKNEYESTIGSSQFILMNSSSYHQIESKISGSFVSMSGDMKILETTISSIFTNTTSSATESVVINSREYGKKFIGDYWIHKETDWLAPTSASQFGAAASIDWSIISGSIFPISASLSTLDSSPANQSKNAVFSILGGYITDQIVGTNLPYNFVFRGAAVKLKRSALTDSGSEFIRDFNIYIGSTLKSLAGTDLSDTTTHWPSSSAEVIYGNNSQTWGQVFTGEQLSSSSFNIKIAAENRGAGGNTSYISDAKIKVYYSYYVSSSNSQNQEYMPLGVKNHRYLGTKMTSAHINEPSLDTIDKGPVVEIIEVNPNQLIIQKSDSNQGSLRFDKSPIKPVRGKLI